jgi:hypothetical protein
MGFQLYGSDAGFAIAGHADGYREFELDRAMLNQILSGLKRKRPTSHGFVPFDVSEQDAGTRTEIAMPAPDGKLLRFTIEDSNTLSPGLAEKYPEFRTFRGRSQNDPRSELRLEITPSGVHAFVRSGPQVFYVQPLRFDLSYLTNSTRYASISADQLRSGIVKFRCTTPGHLSSKGAGRPAPMPELRWGDTYRTYRLAVGTTFQYTQAVGGSKSAALDAIIQTIDQVNRIYESELSVHLELVANEDKLIATDPADTQHNDDANRLLSESQTRIDKIIGDAHYDIGHTFSTGAGGLAQVGVVRRSGVKAMGVTGADQPRGIAFSVDYVAHEMGHEFGANHTFNGNQSWCGQQGFRNGDTAYEPGSGSTILGYAGVCQADDLQLHSDPYFHAASLVEISRYVSGAGDTPNKIATGNSFPRIQVSGPATLPIATPFHLDAAAVDPEQAYQWTFVWEELDLGAQVALSTPDDGHIPLFRSHPPSVGRRDFSTDFARPYADRLPRIPRSSVYRVTARGAGSKGSVLESASLTVNFISGAGAFAVTGPTGAALKAGPTDVLWNVAQTDKAPISAQQVRILISLDGGKTFPTLLLANAPNTGTARVNLPVASAPLIVRVESPDHYFFADSKPTVVHP